jgi:antigen flippase
MFRIILTIGTIQALAILVTFVKSKIVAVLLGPEGVGIVSTIDQVVQSAAYLSAFSLPLASVKFLSRSHSEGDDSFRRCYSSFLKALMILSVAGAVVTVGLAFFKEGLLGPELAKYKTLLVLALLGIPAIVLGGFFSNVFAAARSYKASSLLAFFTNITAATAIAIGVATAGVLGLYIGSALAGLLVVVGALIYARKVLGLPTRSPSASILREMRNSPGIVQFSVMLYLGSITYSISLLVARYAVLTNFGAAEAGLLQGALALAIALGMVLTPANGLYLTPIVNRNISKGEKIRHAVEFQRKLLLISCLAAMPLVLFPHTLLTILFSSKFVSVGQLVFPFVVAQCLSQLAGVHQALLIGFDDLKVYAALTIACHLSMAGLAWLLVPQYGILGVAIAYLVAALGIFLSTMARLKFKHGLTEAGGLSLQVGGALSVVFLTGLFFRGIDERSITAGAFRLGIIAVFALSFLLTLSHEERTSLFGMLRMTGRQQEERSAIES